MQRLQIDKTWSAQYGDVIRIMYLLRENSMLAVSCKDNIEPDRMIVFLRKLAQEIEDNITPCDPIPYREIIESFNEVCGRHFKLSAANKKWIHARWAEGMRASDFAKVCRIKYSQWKDDPKMAIFLRPETLWGTKMEAYLNEPEPKKTKIIRNHLGIEVEVEDD
jgi:uncharacterized phage protein (TIGR02220 family)